MLNKFLKTIAVFSFFLASSQAFAREHIQVTGSSTVYPFATIIAEEFGLNTEYKTPIVEATGTGGGIKLFCSGIGKNFPDFANASRVISESEIEQCQQNRVTPIEIKIGYDGIVLANSKNSKPASLTIRQIFLALADKVPSNGRLIKNPYKKWNQIDKSLPNVAIAVYGPPSTSGTRDAFVELVLEKYCTELPEFQKAYTDSKERKSNCHIIRTDGAFIEAGENDNLIVQKLKNNVDAFGIFGFSFAQQNTSVVQLVNINNIVPSFDNIINGKYLVSRPLFIYLKKENIKIIPGMREFAKEIVHPDAIGSEGYLIERGLIPMTNKELAIIRKRVLTAIR